MYNKPRVSGTKGGVRKGAGGRHLGFLVNSKEERVQRERGRGRGRGALLEIE